MGETVDFEPLMNAMTVYSLRRRQARQQPDRTPAVATPPCLLSNRADDSAWIACGEYGIGNISRHDAAGVDNGSRANPYAGENNRAAPTHTSDPTSTGLPNSSRRRCSALNGCNGV
jgi:hypothetical protein